tara:strand:- start:709 stop:1341 length:633 start_codon:yes stop_codon:yes gene_type:complete
MNIIGLSATLVIILFLHVLIKRYEMMEEDNNQIMEMFKNKFSQIKTEKNVDKIIDDDKQLYNNFQMEKIEDDEGLDIENDFSLLKKDLLKYVNGARNMFNNSLFDKSNEVNSISNQKKNNGNIQEKEMKITDEYLIEHPFKQQSGNSLDNNLNQQVEDNNKNRYASLDYKSFKPDMWVRENENSMNGGKLGPDTSISAFDNMESMDYVLD